MGAAIEFEDVRVSYRTRRRRVPALAGLDLSVPEGGVFGFLGANGAGKTTAIRAAVGLLRGARAIHTTAGGVALIAVWLVIIVGGSGMLFARAEVR